MQRRRIAKTNLDVSVLGLGTVKFGRNVGVKYPHAFQLPNDREILNLFAICKDYGINLIDTAPAYGSSEERIGKLLENRHEWIISTKVGEHFDLQSGASSFDFSVRGVRNSIEQSLKNLHTDYLDIVFVHSDGEDLKLIHEYNVFAGLQCLKDEGKIRAFGMSTKTKEGGCEALKFSDIVMMTFNPTYKDEREVIQKAHENEKGIFIKKAFASGHLYNRSENSIEEVMRFIFNEPGVNSVILGTINPLHLIENIKAVNKVLI